MLYLFQSNFVLICISPNYKFVVDGQPPTNGVQNENAINTQYIYRRIHAEYISQGSKNYRFIPVLVSGAQVVGVSYFHTRFLVFTVLLRRLITSIKLFNVACCYYFSKLITPMFTLHRFICCISRNALGIGC